MRPVHRGHSPQAEDYTNYEDAKPELISRLGSYCSYCERRIATQLAVEHIQPKALPAYQPLIGRWENLLLACVNCNSTKGDRNVLPSDLLLPDRDNSFAAYCYTQDGRVFVRSGLSMEVSTLANTTLTITGLDRASSHITDANGRLVALDRVSQRMEVWLVAQDSRRDLDNDPTNVALQHATVRAALGYGYFSIWMTVFAGCRDMRRLFIEAFKGTQGSGCFDPQTTSEVSPAPNPDRLPNGGKL